MKEWWTRWGQWVGPSALVAILALASRFESCSVAREGAAAYAEANRARISAIEKRMDATDRWIEEHKLVATSRIAQLDSVDKRTDMVSAQAARTDLDVREMKQDIREIRNLLRYRGSGGGGK